MNDRTNINTAIKDELINNLDFINTHWDIQSKPTKPPSGASPINRLISKFQNIFNSIRFRHVNSIANRQAIFNAYITRTLNQLNNQILINEERQTQEITELSATISTIENRLIEQINQVSQTVRVLDEKLVRETTELNQRFQFLDENLLRVTTDLQQQLNQRFQFLDENLLRVTTDLQQQLNQRFQFLDEKLVRETTELNQRFQFLDKNLIRVATDLHQRFQAVETSEQANLDNLCQRLREIDSQINNLMQTINEIDSSLKPLIYTNLAGMSIPKRDRFNYFEFEEVFRGSEDLIKQRQRQYVPYFKGKEKIVDLGSGRGEFLEVLRESGISSIGVDCDHDMVARSKEKGLVVVQNDIFQYLESVHAESIDGIFSAQVIEHLPFEKIDILFRLAYNKLKPDGVLVFETVNPYNLSAFRCFYLDPTHQRPLFPEIISYLCQSSGFNETLVKFISPDTCLSQDGTPEKNAQWSCGDYAIIAKK